MSATVRTLALAAAGIAFADVAWAHNEAALAEAAYIFDTFFLLMCGALVVWMAAGFCMLEAGLVRGKNAAAIGAKNIGLYSIAGLAYFLVGYNLMYTGVDGGFAGVLRWFEPPEPLYGAGDRRAGAAVWFFQMAFVATAASIVSGAVAERIRIWPFFFFIAVLTGLVYPVSGSWLWGGGWLADVGFKDFAGATIVHAAGGWAALAGVLLLGPRSGKFGPDGEVRPMPGSALPLSTLGVFMLWIGWFGFNGGSQMALGTGDNAAAVARIFANTNLAAAGGVIAAMIAVQTLYGKADLTIALNGALGGLVSITAEPLAPGFTAAVLIGGVGGALVAVAIPMLDRLRVDDVVGAVPVHLVCGIWGTLAVPLTNPDATFRAQIMGVLAVGAFAAASSFVVWAVLKGAIGIRLADRDEKRGADRAELGLEAWPEFGKDARRT